ncbi:hypothetical protein [Moraxella equi]|uniref:Uncharacterized protein n=1 Tax=Moraxella equi TaxID=60442 RepID=A0A378QPD8_9GAMM|nr:hypothetical protein [Moraxella equi]OPH39689.1 hypothetical protein B5J93_02905 [Moraxella equi]STZ02342.1 Uncharacterised protein [Moraxella equi]
MKKVWSASIDLVRMKVYPIGSSYDGLFDYHAYRLNEIKITQNPDSQILKQKNQEDWNRICEISASDYFEKSRVLPSSLWLETTNCPKDGEYLF